MPEPNWDRSLALRTIHKADTQATLKPLFQMARAGSNRELLDALSAIVQDPGLSAPAKDYTVFSFTLGLGDLDVNSVSPKVLDFLSTYQSRTLVAHDDHPRMAVPLFNIRAAVAGVQNSWDRQQAAARATSLLQEHPDQWISSYLAAGPAGRRGFVDALDFAPPEQLRTLGWSALALLDEKPELTLVTAKAAMNSGDFELLQQSISRGDGPGLSRALKTAAHTLSADQIGDLLDFSLQLGSETKAALAKAHLAPALLDEITDRKTTQSSTLEDSNLGATEAQNPRISEWVENAPASDADKIALGYPVPIPVDTPLPFDGFRSYSGLHTRHQDLANTTPWSHALEIGQTRMGRTIWAYQLGDEDHMTVYGLPEHAMLTNGGIHAREWQSPEVATGIIELLALSEDENHLISYLRDNANILVIPVLNVDGFLQTQRTPSTNWIDTDPDDPEFSPRDGRMRRKNMLGADEDLFTQADHLNGVDLNRNFLPYWNTSPQNSSDDLASIVHHGASPLSEPETQALDAAAQLGPAEKLTMFTDMHSFSQRHAWARNSNDGLTSLTQRLLTTFTNHHVEFDAAKFYWFPTGTAVQFNQGWGMTYEYFTESYQVPSWVLEIEPSGGSHTGLPGAGADYGGLGRNGHDGFILPDSEVERVRTELAQTFAVAYYQQAGPPSIVAVRMIDDVTGAVVMESEWDVSGETSRKRYSFQAQPLQLDREYTFWLAFDKPMRWREDGEVTVLPGQPGFKLDLDAELKVGDADLSVIPIGGQWLDVPGDAPGGYLRYRDDTLSIGFSMPADANNLNLLNGTAAATLGIAAWDMTGSLTDANPSTVARWEEGSWAGYENNEGRDGANTGGMDSTTRFQITSESLGDPFVIEAGTSSAWYDPARNDEGFMLEILADNIAVMYWFTYNLEGAQDWYIAQGEIRGNRILFPELMQVSGGEFGPGFDRDKVTRQVVGSASFIWSGCDSGAMDWLIDQDGNDRRHGRMNLTRITRVMGLECGRLMGPPEIPEGQLSGSWYDPTHSGEGYVLEVLINRQVLVYWFSFDQQGNRRWFFGKGEILDGKLVFSEMFTTLGGIFGEERWVEFSVKILSRRMLKLNHGVRWNWNWNVIRGSRGLCRLRRGFLMVRWI